MFHWQYNATSPYTRRFLQQPICYTLLLIQIMKPCTQILQHLVWSACMQMAMFFIRLKYLVDILAGAPFGLTSRNAKIFQLRFRQVVEVADRRADRRADVCNRLTLNTASVKTSKPATCMIMMTSCVKMWPIRISKSVTPEMQSRKN